MFYILFRVASLMFEPLRFYLLYDRIRHRYDDEIRSSTKYVLNRCYIGDWFVLYQLSRKADTSRKWNNITAKKGKERGLA